MTLTREHRLAELGEMLASRRPAGSKTERQFIRRYIRPLGVSQDASGNLIKRIGTAPVLWSSHTDTVHRCGGVQSVARYGGTFMLAANETVSNCLGADCTAGVWLMVNMIRAGKPGLYVFHRGEECGGIGSNAIARNTPGLLNGITAAIAFDRRGKDSVITHQGWGRGCSDAFARALGKGLGMAYRPDDTGIFTDTANYVDLVPECTNLSVGYANEHRAGETLDADHLLSLLDAVLALDTDALPIIRDPGDFDDYDSPTASPPDGKNTWSAWFDDHEGWSQDLHKPDMRTLIRDHPNTVAGILEAYGFDACELQALIEEAEGVVIRRPPARLAA